MTLDRLLGEHALLAIWATQAGLQRRQELPGARQAARPELGRDLEGDRSVYGAAAAKQFLNGKNLWRAHINYFVDYTMAIAKKDKAARRRRSRT